jgi:rRNA maturation endonuclease Nob1
MSSRPVIISMIIAIGLIIFSEVFLVWIAKKTKAVTMDPPNIWKKKEKKVKKPQVVCKSCGADNPPENNFCGSCGKSL